MNVLPTRDEVKEKIETLRQQGICYVCHDLQTGEIFGTQSVIYEDADFRVVLELHPRMVGHTIVLYKPHREDVSELAADETAHIFQMCVRVIQAIKQALGAEKVYLVTMCDGPINHLHIQLLPRYPGEPIGSKRLVDPRGTLTNAASTTAAIRNALHL
ncbi:MAG: HIT family protein [Anaerolineae bacterium]|nr:HIT family protein [Anaerolineae bacterium]